MWNQNVCRTIVKSTTVIKNRENDEVWQTSHWSCTSTQPVARYAAYTRVRAPPLTWQPVIQKKERSAKTFVVCVFYVLCWEFLDGNFLRHLVWTRCTARRTLPRTESTQCLSLLTRLAHSAYTLKRAKRYAVQKPERGAPTLVALPDSGVNGIRAAVALRANRMLLLARPSMLRIETTIKAFESNHSLS